MLEVDARDGAGRITTVSWGEPKLSTPGILWLSDRLPPGAHDWQPQLSTRPDPKAHIVATTRFSDEAPEPGGALLLRRQLVPTPTVLEDRPHLLTTGDVAVWTGAAALFRDPKRFAVALVKARQEAAWSRALYAPGLGEPQTLALLAYAGIDLFDSVPLHMAAAQGRFLTDAGSIEASQATEASCACPACLGEAPVGLTESELAAHNQWAARTELGLVRQALRDGRLRELVEGRVRAHPELTALFRRFDSQYDHFELRIPVQRHVALHATTKESLQRAECRRFRERVASRYRPPLAPPVLLLLPCSHRKPYSKSRTHRAFADAIWGAGAAGLVHEVILTSPLGLVPRELELTYPAAHYDVPVTGEWDDEEGAMIRGLLAGLLAKRSYARVVSHLPRHTYELVRGLLPSDTLVTCEGENATAPEAIKRLELTLRELGKSHARAQLPHLQFERLKALADYQFGPRGADALFAGGHVVGKWPTGKLFVGKEQLAMLPTERGLLSLSMAGAKRLLEAGVHRVEIDDFRPKGGVFAVGVRAADSEIRPGDEVVLHHGGDLRGVGVARMSGPEMVEMKRGEAVGVRHHA